MRRQLPLFLVGAFGFAMLLQYFTPAPVARAAYGRVLEWMQVIFAAGLVVGGFNYALTHLRKLRAPGRERIFSALALAALFLMTGAGVMGGIERGSLFSWLFMNVQAPLQQTVFSLLAFFVASAAFRGFRARSIEAALLLAVAVIVMLGRIPPGEAAGIGLPEAARWLVDVPAVAAKRGILIGIGLGSVAVALRVMLGIERAWLGGSR